MSKFQSKAQRATTAIAVAAVLAAGLLTTTASMASAFDNKMQSVIAHVKADPNYKSIPLATTSDREWFFNECEALYKNKITKEQYMADGAKQFPGYEASFAEVADLLTKA
ncbi:hypothetical protein [Scleromatobacter humisilvae]|uniref:Uncharacterized protein n=1 Tax=Scleromatobacter humisilvae TaxID=2897159 RepID=A0A9X2C179_9BURK|nr:hypothetical protein [Scleromatobacter humisilvae]MCK9687992.1 hypothetical protein [Scleromatobacter humisilvae]